MPKVRQRTTEKGADQVKTAALQDLLDGNVQLSYSREDLNKAVKEVRDGTRGLRPTAKLYGIPRTTLRHYVNGTRGQKGILSQGTRGGGGRMALSFEDEKSLASCIKTVEKWGFGLSRDESMDIVQLFVIANNLSTPFKDNRPGEAWFLNFKKRHRLSIKKPQGVEYARSNQENPFIIHQYFDMLEETFTNNNLRNKPHLVFNCDESSISRDPSKSRVVGATGEASTRTISTSGRDNTTVLMCVSASGAKLPNLTVFKGKNILDNWVSTADEVGTLNQQNNDSYAASTKGWMDSEIFLNWFKKVFLPNIPEERPVLLIVDGHGSHVTVPLVEAAIVAQVIIVKLPPHTTHRLQPMDVAVFKSLKNSWEKNIAKWQRENPRRKIPKNELVKLVGETFHDMNPEVIRNGFKAAGVYDPDIGGPNREHAIKKCKFRTDDVLAYLKAKENKNTNETVQDESGNKSSIVPATPSTSNATTATLPAITQELIVIDVPPESPVLPVAPVTVPPVIGVDPSFHTDIPRQVNSPLLISSQESSVVQESPSIPPISESPQSINPRQVSTETQADQPTAPISELSSSNNPPLVSTVSECSLPSPSISDLSLLSTPSQTQTRPLTPMSCSSSESGSSKKSFEDIITELFRGRRTSSPVGTPKPAKKRRVCSGAEVLTTAEFIAKQKAWEEEAEKEREAKEKKEAEREVNRKRREENRERIVENKKLRAENKKRKEEEKEAIKRQKEEIKRKKEAAKSTTKGLRKKNNPKKSNNDSTQVANSNDNATEGSSSNTDSVQSPKNSDNSVEASTSNDHSVQPSTSNHDPISALGSDSSEDSCNDNESDESSNFDESLSGMSELPCDSDEDFSDNVVAVIEDDYVMVLYDGHKYP